MPMSAQILHLASGDETTLQYLGAAVVLQWTLLPEEVRRSVMQQATSVGGLPPVTSLREQIEALIRRTRS